MITLSSRSRHVREGDAFKRQQETWRRAYAEALSLRERFPGVEQLVIEMSFSDARAIGTYSPITHSFSPSAKAFLVVPCPRTLCLDGGFEIEPIVIRVLQAGKRSAVGTLRCGGRLEQGALGSSACDLRMNYRIELHYELAVRET
jgi:hypothetical protein